MTAIEETIKSIHERADYIFNLGIELRPSINKVTICLEKGTTLDKVTTTKEQIEKWKKPNIKLEQWEIEFFKKDCKATDEQIENIKKYGYFANGINILMGFVSHGKLVDSFLQCFDFDNNDDITLKDFLNGDKKEDLAKSYYIEDHIEPSCRIHIILRVNVWKLFRPISESSKDFAGIGVHANHWITIAPSPYTKINKSDGSIVPTPYKYTKLEGGVDLGQTKLIPSGSKEFEDLRDRLDTVEFLDRQRKREEELFKILEPHLGESEENKRHDRYLHLIGLIKKNTNKSKEDTIELVTKLCKRFNNESSLNDRLTIIDTTWNQKDEDISGYEGLKSFMENEELEKLKKLLGVDMNKNGNKKKNNDEKENDKPRITTFKYSDKGKGNLYESVLVDGKPCFMVYNNDNVEIKDGIEENNRILTPPEEDECSYEPYEFKNLEEVKQYVERAKEENHDSLFRIIRNIITKYNDHKQNKINLIATDVFFSYFQDRFSVLYIMTFL